jgi:hypothetical protein
MHAGSSTACIVCLNGVHINAANLGDSGFMLVRDGKLHFETPAQQHSFNFPFQVGSHGDPVGSSQVRPLAPYAPRSAKELCAGTESSLCPSCSQI